MGGLICEVNKMTGKKKPRRIYNPVTGKYYEVRQKTTTEGRRGQIKGLWSSKKRVKKNQ